MAIAAATFGLCLYHLGARSIWLDEGATYAIATQHGLHLLWAVGHDGGNLALYYLLLHGWTSLFGSGEVVLRLPSALAAVATVLLTFLLGRELAGRRAGLYAALLIGLSLPLVYWGQMARGYTLGSALAALTGLCFVVARRSGRRRDCLLWALAALALCWTLLLGALVVVAGLATLCLPGAAPAARRRLAAAAVLVAAGGFPLVLIAAHRGDGQLFWLPRPTANTVRSVLDYLAGARYGARWGDLSLALVFCAAALMALGLLLALRTPRRHPEALFAAVFAVLGTALLPLVSYVVSRLGQPVFTDRYLSPCLPAAAVALALPLARLRPAALGLLAVVALAALRVGQLTPTYGVDIDDEQATVVGVVSLAAPGDCIAFYANDGFVDFNYYLSHPPPGMGEAPRFVSLLPARPMGSDPVIVERYVTLDRAARAALPERCGRLFLIEQHDGNPHGTPAARVLRSTFGKLQHEVAREYAAHIVRRYQGVTFFLYSSPHHPAPHHRVAAAPSAAPTP
ncbi:MAG TPA: glycosyltransferase family 39 protein [Acidimicrobiales bacterium]|nr:glycosyltransferase family 39 protein [Acidimicrobiales bacterium]